MPAWLSVYCSQVLGDMPSAETLAAEIRNNDYWTLAEDFEIDEDLVDPALASLRIEYDPADPSGFDLHYRPEDQRPVIVHYWADYDRVQEEIEEVLEQIEDHSAADRIRENLQSVKAVVGIEMGYSQLEDMGIVFAYEIARWFGRNRGGMIRDNDDYWIIDAGGGFNRL